MNIVKKSLFPALAIFTAISCTVTMAQDSSNRSPSGGSLQDGFYYWPGMNPPGIIFVWQPWSKTEDVWCDFKNHDDYVKKLNEEPGLPRIEANLDEIKKVANYWSKPCF
jgi:hypothetical protein